MMCAERERRHDEFLQLIRTLESRGFRHAEIAARTGYARRTSITNMKNGQCVISPEKLENLRKMAQEHCK